MRARIALAATLALLCVAPAAHADAVPPINCTFAGTFQFGFHTPILGTAGVPWLMQATTTCTVNGSPVVASLSGDGSYDNTLCGTGRLTGVLNIPGLGTRSVGVDLRAYSGDMTVGPGGTPGFMVIVPTDGAPTSAVCPSQGTVIGYFGTW